MIVDAILSVLIAPACAACDAPLERPALGCVCPGCWAAIHPLTEPLCETCGDALPTWRLSSVSATRCARCRRLPRVISAGRAVAPYEGRMRDILHALKYRGRRSVAKPLGHLMSAAAPQILAGADFAVPVPLHFIRHYRRGFNQAEEIAAFVTVPMLRALRRWRRTSTQIELPEAARHTNVRDAFVVRRHARRVVRGATLVLVDDVSTTGATLDACARVLLEAGAKEVRALTAARAVSRQR